MRPKGFVPAMDPVYTPSPANGSTSTTPQMTQLPDGYDLTFSRTTTLAVDETSRDAQITFPTTPPKVERPDGYDLTFSRSTTLAVDETNFAKDPEAKGAFSCHISPIRRNAILLTLSLAQFFDIYNACVAIIALPTLGKELGFQVVDLPWVVSAYTLTFAAFMLISGRLCDILHPKPVFVMGFLIIGLLSIPIGASVNPLMIIILRAVQGIGAALNIPAAVSMISTTFPDPIAKSRAYAMYGAFGAIGNVAGFVLGGVLTAKASWRWVFYLLAILVVPFALASWFILPNSESATGNDRKRGLDWPGVSTFTIGLVLFVFAISSGHGPTWGSPKVIVPLTLSVLLFVAFFFIERRVSDPALPPRTWTNKNFTIIFFYGWSVYWWLFAAQLGLVEIFMNIWQWSALSTAVHCLPMGIAGVISAYLSGLFAPQIPRRVMLVLGQLFMAVGSILFALADTPDKFWSYLVPGEIVGMIGFSAAYVGSTITIMEGARKGEEGVVSAMIYTSYQVGATIGVAIVTTITFAINGVGAHGDGHGPVAHAGYAASFWSLLALNGLTALGALLFVRG